MDDPSFNELLEHEAFLRRLAARLADDAHGAEDLVQETWLAGLRRPPRASGNLRGWLRTVARRISRRRRRRSELERESERRVAEDLPRAAELELERDGLRRSVASAVDELREPYRTVVLLRWFEGLPPREIARRTGRPINTVQSQLRRALSELRGRLDAEHGRDRASWALVLLASPRKGAAHPAGAGAAAGAASGLATWTPRLLLAFSLAGVLVWSIARDGGAGSGAETVLAALDARDVPAPLVAPAATPEREAFAVASVPAGASSAQAAPGVVEVLVVDQGGAPLADARIVVGAVQGASGGFGEHGSRFAARTDAQGRARVELLPGELGSVPGLERCVFLSAHAPGHGDGLACYVVPPPEGAPPLVLEVGPPGRDLRGRVIAGDGRGIEGARLRLGEFRRLALEAQRMDVLVPLFTSSRPDGSFEYTGAPLGRHLLAITAEGFAPALRWVQAEAGPLDELVFALEREARLAGTVRDEAGAPVAGARLFVEPESLTMRVEGTSDAEGRFELAGLPGGERYAFARSPEGTLVARGRVLLVCGRTASWEPVLGPRPALSLRLVDERGEGRAGLVLRLQLERELHLWSRELVADDQGRVALHDCPEEALRAAIFAAEAERVAEAAPLLVVGGLLPREAEHVLVVPAESSAPTRLFGHVLSAEGAPLASAAVFARELASGHLDARPADPSDGRFELSGLPPGRHSLVVFAGALGAAKAEVVTLEPGTAHDLGTVRLPRPGSLRLRWNWPAGRSLEVVQLLDGQRWTVAVEATPASGERALLPGLYRLRVKSGNITVEALNVTIEEGALLEHASGPLARYERRIVLAPREGETPGPAATLRVQAADGTPVAADSPPGDEHELVFHVVASPEGELAIDLPLPAGRWHLAAESATGLVGEALLELAPGPPGEPLVIPLR